MSERVQGILLWLVAISLIVGTSIALQYAGGYRRIAGFENPVLLPPNVTLRLMNVTATGRRNNQKAWTMSAKQVDSSKDRSRVDFVGDIKVTLYSEGRPRATLNADMANYLAPNQTLLVGGHVVGIMKDPKAGTDDLKMETTRIQWNIGSRQVTAPEAVTLTLKDGTITGTQLMVDLKTRDYSMKDFKADLALDGDTSPSDTLNNLVPSKP